MFFNLREKVDNLQRAYLHDFYIKEKKRIKIVFRILNFVKNPIFD